MYNTCLNKTKMTNQDPQVRAHNFKEVSLGYTDEEALNEANRCIGCKNAHCIEGCPVHIDIPGFIGAIKESDLKKAANIIAKSSMLPAICGRVCPQEEQCEKRCTRAIKGEAVAIGNLERYVADHMEQLETEMKPKNGKKVAVIGSGPAGLTCASDLAKAGFDVTIYEALHTAGGVLMYGIPEFRLPKSIVSREVQKLKAMGVKIETNMVIGKVLTIEELQCKFDAIFIGSGAGLPKFMNIPGEDLKGVYSANEFLTRVNLMKAYKDDSKTPINKGKHVAVIGGGNVAMDAARSALRLGADKVYIIYRRGMEELPARKEEVHHAIEEGIVFNLLTNPVKINGDENNNVVSIECVKMELGEPDASGRRRPVVVLNSNHTIDVDVVIMALGTTPNPLLKDTTPGLETSKWGGLVVNENEETTIPFVYAGGDAVSGAATVILAMGAGKKAAKEIEEKLIG